MKLASKSFLLICLSGSMISSFAEDKLLKNLRYNPESIDWKQQVPQERYNPESIDWKQQEPQDTEISMWGQSGSFTKANDLSIIFVGDSLSRYQYLSLANYLHSGATKWFDADVKRENPVVEHSFDGWAHFYRVTNEQLQPYETCDCYRDEGKFQWEYLPYMTENRFYLDKSTNNNLGYVQKLGKNDAKWSWDPSTVHDEREYHGVIQSREEVNYIGNGHWMAVIREYISQISPKFKVIVFNAGWWKNYFFHEDLQVAVFEEIRKAGMISVYKTTTTRRGEHDEELAEYEIRACEKADFCLDLSWTGHIPDYMYVDQYHFAEPVYRLMNSQLLGMLEEAGVF